MLERKDAIIHVNQVLCRVSLGALVAISSSVGCDDTVVLPDTLIISETLKSLIENVDEEQLDVAVPAWWTQEARSQSWQKICTSIENGIPHIINNVEEILRKRKKVEAPIDIKSLFVEHTAQWLTACEVTPHDCAMVAGYVAPLFLEKFVIVLRAIAHAHHEDTLVAWLMYLAEALDCIQKALRTTPPSSSMRRFSDVHHLPSVAITLEQKRQYDLYDIYICYDEADEVDVLHIGERLKARGILPWFDLLEVRPGDLEKRAQEQQIQKIPAAAVFVGKHTIVDKQELQMYSFIGEFLARGIAIIPVLLPSAPQELRLPPYLGTFGRVDFRRSLPEPMDQFIWGITGQRP